jgi:hypothetical protein
VKALTDDVAFFLIKLLDPLITLLWIAPNISIVFVLELTGSSAGNQEVNLALKQCLTANIWRTELRFIINRNTFFSRKIKAKLPSTSDSVSG